MKKIGLLLGMKVRCVISILRVYDVRMPIRDVSSIDMMTKRCSFPVFVAFKHKTLHLSLSNK